MPQMTRCLAAGLLWGLGLLMLASCSPASNAPGAPIREFAVTHYCATAKDVDEDWLECAPTPRPASEVDEGNFDAALGKLYAEGNGVPKDEDRAFRLYEAGAKLDNADAINGLGECYAEEHGVARDDAKAAALFERAAGLGNEAARKNLEKMTAEGRFTPEKKGA